MSPEAFKWFIIQSYWKVYGQITEDSPPIFDENGNGIKEEIYMAYFQKEDKK